MRADQYCRGRMENKEGNQCSSDRHRRGDFRDDVVTESTVDAMGDFVVQDAMAFKPPPKQFRNWKSPASTTYHVMVMILNHEVDLQFAVLTSGQRNEYEEWNHESFT